MAIVFAETPDATQGFEFLNAVTGTVTYDTTTPRVSGLASWKCDSDVGDAIASLEVTSNARRVSVYFRFSHLPDSTVVIFDLGSVLLKITSGGVLQLYNSSDVQDGGDGSTLSTGTDYRICLATDGGTNPDVKMFLDGIEDIDPSQVIGQANGPYIFGWVEAPGSNKVVNISHIYGDNIADLTDTGDIRVTSKLPLNSGGTNGWDGSIGTPALDDRPIDEATGHTHAGSDDVIESSDIQAATTGDEDLIGATIVGHVGWIWADRGSGGAGSPSILVNDAETLITLSSGAPNLFMDINTSATYPTGGTDEIGMHSTDGSANTNFYEGGVLIVYTPAAAPAAGQAYGFWF